MKKLDFNLESNPFINFQSARYCMCARVNAENTYRYSKEKGYSFFLITLGCIIKAVNTVPELRRRIVDGQAIEHSSLDGVTPIMDEKNSIFREVRVKSPVGYESVEKWHDEFKRLEREILSLEKPGFEIEMEKRDLENIVNCSCIPWVDFDAITNCVVDGKAIQPLVTWGKFNDNGEIPVSITVSHIFVNGRELGYFYENLQKCLDNPQDMIRE